MAVASYYRWQQKGAARSLVPAWERTLCQVFVQHKRRYGTRRLRAELHAQGYPVGRHRIRQALRRRELVAVQPRAFVPRTTQSEQGHASRPITYWSGQPPRRPTRSGWGTSPIYRCRMAAWAYLAAFQDVYTKRVVGWQVLGSMPEELVVSALRQALFSRQPVAGLLVHSDRGGQYCGNAYRRLLTERHLVRSMSRRGECYDNAQAESLWSRVKTEVLLARSSFRFRSRSTSRTGHVF